MNSVIINKFCNYNTGFWSRGIIPSNYFSDYQNNYAQVSLNLPVDIVLFTLKHIPSYSTAIQPQIAAYIRCVEQ